MIHCRLSSRGLASSYTIQYCYILLYTTVIQCTVKLLLKQNLHEKPEQYCLLINYHYYLEGIAAPMPNFRRAFSVEKAVDDDLSKKVLFTLEYDVEEFSVTWS